MGSAGVLIPGPPAKAAFWATLFFWAAGGMMGLLGGLAWAVWFDGILAPGWRLLIAGALGALAGGTIGFLTGGQFEPRSGPRTTPARLWRADPRRSAPAAAETKIVATEDYVNLRDRIGS